RVILLRGMSTANQTKWRRISLLGICLEFVLPFALEMAMQLALNVAPMEPLGPKLRRQRRRLGLTLDELAGRTGISKPYLSLIETGRVPNPPSDQKLRRLEQVLGFTAGELLTQAHLQRTPRDVRVMLSKLISQRSNEDGGSRMADGEKSSASS